MFSPSISLPNDDPRLWLAVADAVEAAGGSAWEIRKKVAVADILDHCTDEEILAYFQPQIDAPLILASAYGSMGRVHFGREISGTSMHDRRPVLMRGCKYAMIQRYANSSSHNPAGYCEAVFWRYVRLRKLTILSADEWDEIAAPVLRRLSERYPSIRNSRARDAFHYEFRFAFDRRFRVLKGRKIWLRPEAQANFDELARIVIKFKKIEERRSAASQHFKSRMSEATEARRKQLMQRKWRI